KIMVDYGRDLAITGVTTGGPGASTFVISGMPTNLSPGGVASNFMVHFDADREGTRAAWLVIQTPTTNFILNLTAQIFSASVQRGPAAGGNTLIITNLALGGDAAVTNVLIDGVPTPVSAQGDNWMAIIMPAHGAGAVDIILQTLASGDLLLASAYRYNPAGEIGWSGFGEYRWTNLGSGVSSTLNSMAYDPSNGVLYAGGAFSVAGGVACSRVARWNGVAWTNLGSGLNGACYAMAVGGDARLYVGGVFTRAGGVTSMYVACWNGETWTNLGEGVGATVNALAVGRDGALYAGGIFTNAGTLGVNRVAMWDGVAWTNLGGGVDGVVNSLDVGPDGKLYAGGAFITASGAPMNYVAAWNGTNWGPLASGFGGQVRSVHYSRNGVLYAGGTFTTAGTSSVPRAAQWTGEAWSGISIGMNSELYAMHDDAHGHLYAGGTFSIAGGFPASYIARWDGSVWNAMGAGLGSTPLSLVSGGPHELFAGGLFTTAGSIPANRIAKWYASPVSSFGVMPTNGAALGGSVIVIEGTHLGDGGDITNVTLCGAPVASIVSQCATQVVVITAPGTPGPGDVVVYSTSYGPTLKTDAFHYMIPEVTLLGTNLAWVPSDNTPTPGDGTDFGPVMAGEQSSHVFYLVNNTTNALTVSGVTSSGTHAAWFVVAGCPASVPAGETGEVEIAFGPTSGGAGSAALLLSNDATNYLLNVRGEGNYSLYPPSGPSAGGNLLTITNLVLETGDTITNVLVDAQEAFMVDAGADWVTVLMPAHVDGMVDILVQSTLLGDTLLVNAYAYNPQGVIGWTEYGPFGWQAMDEDMNSTVIRMVPDGSGGLYVAGYFTAIGNSNINYIARWAGDHWSSLGAGANNYVLSLATNPTNGYLYAGGYFTFIGGITASRLAEWNGEAWTNLASGMNSSVFDIKVDTNGHVYAAGAFTTAGGASMARIAKWNGVAWTNLAEGLSSTCYALAMDSNGYLYAGGSFTTAGTCSAVRVAMWNGETWTNLGSGVSST
ncbi:MAG: choice-of-anchor D domain-containing protein, partial [Spartobacteria bacterium]|nr:choice-of-anchor D domain-containing protein [Spartobacteria bacterium]